MEGSGLCALPDHHERGAQEAEQAKRSFFLSGSDRSGFVSEAVVNFVALLGRAPENNQEIFSLDELVKEFNYKNISKSPAVFDMVKLKWMNGEYIKAMDFDAFYDLAEPYIKEVIHRDCDYKKNCTDGETRIEIFPDIKEHIDFFEAVPEYDIAMYTHKKMKTTAETSLAVLKDVLPLMEAQEDYSNDALYAMLSSYVKENGYKNGYVMWPIRTALSGKQMTPGGATELMEVLGKMNPLRVSKQLLKNWQRKHNNESDRTHIREGRVPDRTALLPSLFVRKI